MYLGLLLFLGMTKTNPKNFNSYNTLQSSCLWVIIKFKANYR